MRMTEKVGIRKCSISDVARTAGFYDRVVLWLDAHVNYPRWEYQVYPGEQSVRKMAEAGAQYVCERGDAILGAFSLDADPQGTFRKGQWSRELAHGSYMVLHALAVDPEMRGRGLASEIIRFCADRARSEGCKALRVDVVPTNAPARRLFEKNGFTYAGDCDLELNIEGIPVFSLYELNL